jgi:hypothetical protein
LGCCKAVSRQATYLAHLMTGGNAMVENFSRDVNARRAVAEKIWERLRQVPVERSKRQHAAHNQRRVIASVPRLKESPHRGSAAQPRASHRRGSASPSPLRPAHTSRSSFMARRPFFDHAFDSSQQVSPVHRLFNHRPGGPCLREAALRNGGHKDTRDMPSVQFWY